MGGGKRPYPERIERRTVDALRAKGFRVHHNGFPDLLIEGRDSEGNLVAAFIEMKEPLDVIRDHQALVLDYLSKAPRVVATVLRSPDAVLAFLTENGISSGQPESGERALREAVEWYSTQIRRGLDVGESSETPRQSGSARDLMRPLLWPI